jgi:MFS family permease
MDGAIAAGTQTTVPAALEEPYAAALPVAVPVSGTLSDRSGRRKPIIIGLSPALPTQVLPVATDRGRMSA